LRSLRQFAQDKVRGWSARRHGRDALPITISRRRLYILPTRLGAVLGCLLVAMLLAGLNYNSNLGLAFAFMMASLTLVIMHHCNRNMLSLSLDATTEVDAFAGGEALAEIVLRNRSRIERRDVEVRCGAGVAQAHVPAEDSNSLHVAIPVSKRGVERIRQIEMRTRYPFGWFRAWTYVHVPLVIYVAPAPVGARTLPSVEGAGAAEVTDRAGDEEFSGLRSYSPGVPLKHMAWKVLARGGEAAVRSYTSLGAQPEWLDWSSLEALDDEARLSQLCQWVLDADRAHRPYGLRLPGNEIPPSGGAAHRFACLRALATFGEPP
jgi:uncharacterized protein (DUF58 family)